MAKTAKTTKKTTATIDQVSIRLYRAGTGDCFLLQFKAGATVKCKMMIDCGCILGARKDFEPWLENIKEVTGGKIDILVVTHEHADHINGFKACSDLFDELTFDKVWFSWTEDESDDVANDLRRNHSKLNLALHAAVTQLNGLVKEEYYEKQFQDEFQSNLMVEGKKHFIHSLDQLNSLNMNQTLGAAARDVPSMVDLFTDFKIIKEDTKVEFLSPGELLKQVAKLPGMRIFVLGPPRDTSLLNITEADGEHFDKREKKSTKDFAFAAAILGDGNGTDVIPFESEYELGDHHSDIKEDYEKNNAWQKIDTDWLYTAGSLALRYERSINNTSLALAFQFEDSERVLLFPGDAEFGNWKSWHDLEWTIKVDGKNKKVNAEYLLNNTVFYKIGHHCSQNGSASRLGVDMMTHEDLTVMAPLNFAKIQTGWLNTMPNDLLCASLIAKTKGRFYFSGDRNELMPNIKTKRVTVKKSHEAILNKLNKEFDGEVFIDCNIEG